MYMWPKISRLVFVLRLIFHRAVKVSMSAVSTNRYWDKCRRVSSKELENEVLRLTENLRRRKLIASETLSAFEQE